MFLKPRPCQISAEYNGKLVTWKFWPFTVLLYCPLSQWNHSIQFWPITREQVKIGWNNFRRSKFPVYQLTETSLYSANICQRLSISMTFKIIFHFSFWNTSVSKIMLNLEHLIWKSVKFGHPKIVP